MSEPLSPPLQFGAGQHPQMSHYPTLTPRLLLLSSGMNPTLDERGLPRQRDPLAICDASRMLHAGMATPLSHHGRMATRRSTSSFQALCMLVVVLLLLRQSSQNTRLLETVTAHRTISQWSSLLSHCGGKERQRCHEQLCDTTHHHCTTGADPCSAVRLLLATVASWPAIPCRLVVNALYLP